MLLRACAARARLGLRLRAVVVDHGLRPGSDDEAARAAAFARGLDIDADIKTWRGDKPPRGVQAAARAARYRLLAAACAETGARVVATGHTRDDQAETLWMRRRRPGRGSRAMSAMAALAPLPVWPEGRGVALARPLLRCGRRELRAELAARGFGWIDDPSNQDLRFERVRARAALAGAAGLRARLLTRGRRAGRRDAATRRRAAGVFAHAVAFDAHGAARLSRGALAGVDAPAAGRALEALLQAVSGAPASALRDKLAGLRRALALSERFTGATMGGCVFSAAGPDAVDVTRDLGALKGRADGAFAAPQPAVATGERVVWDGRFVTEPAEVSGVVAARLGPSSAPRGLRAAPVLRACDGSVKPIGACFIGAELAARALFVESPTAWADHHAAGRALGAGVLRAHVSA